MDRITQIKQKVDLWFQFKLSLSVDDIMPDIVFLIEELEKSQQKLKKEE